MISGKSINACSLGSMRLGLVILYSQVYDKLLCLFYITKHTLNLQKKLLLINFWLFARIPGCTRKGATGQVCFGRGPTGRWKENVGALHLHGNWGEHVWFDRCQHCGQVPRKGWAPDDVTHGFQGMVIIGILLLLITLLQMFLLACWTMFISEPVGGTLCYVNVTCIGNSGTPRHFMLGMLW